MTAGNHVCVVLLSGLGDVIHGLPMVNALKRADPSTRITWVVEPMAAPVLEGHPAIDEVVVFEKRRGLAGVMDLRRTMADLAPRVTLNCNIYFKSVFPTLFSGAPLRVGFDRGRARDMTWLFVNKRVSGPRRHTQDMFLELLGPLGVDPHPLEWRLEPTGPELEAQAAFFARFERPVAAVVPTSAHVAKDWIPERWAAVLDLLEQDFGFQTVILGGPSDRERAVVGEILSATRAKPVVAMGDGIRPLLWRLHGSDMLIAPDTGPLHMSRAMDVPVVGLYGHTNPWRVGPYRKFEDLWVDRYSEPDAPHDPSLAMPKNGRMEQITVRDVAERVQIAVDRYGVARKGRRP